MNSFFVCVLKYFSNKTWNNKVNLKKNRFLDMDWVPVSKIHLSICNNIIENKWRSNLKNIIFIMKTIFRQFETAKKKFFKWVYFHFQIELLKIISAIKYGSKLLFQLGMSYRASTFSFTRKLRPCCLAALQK